MPRTKKTITPTIEQDHPLLNLVPDQHFVESYVSRDLDGVPDLDAIAAAHRMRHNVLLFGPTGAAKTSFVYAYGAKIGMPVVNVACNGGVDVRQLIGGWQPKSDGGYHYVPGDLVLGVMHGAIILLNEVNFMPPKIAAVIYGLLDRRRTIYLPDAAGSDYPTSIKAHPTTLVVADFNPGYQGTRPLNQAFRNRFAFKYEWGYEQAVETELVGSTVLLSLAQDLRKRADAGDLATPVSTNMMLEFEDIAYDEALGLDFAISMFVNAFEEDERAVVREVFAVNRDRLVADMFDTTNS